MKVKELIQSLIRFNQDLDVFIEGIDGLRPLSHADVLPIMQGLEAETGQSVEEATPFYAGWLQDIGENVYHFSFLPAVILNHESNGG